MAANEHMREPSGRSAWGGAATSHLLPRPSGIREALASSEARFDAARQSAPMRPPAANPAWEPGVASRSSGSAALPVTRAGMPGGPAAPGLAVEGTGELLMEARRSRPDFAGMHCAFSCVCRPLRARCNAGTGVVCVLLKLNVLKVQARAEHASSVGLQLAATALWSGPVCKVLGFQVLLLCLLQLYGGTAMQAWCAARHAARRWLITPAWRSTCATVMAESTDPRRRVVRRAVA